MTHYDKSVEDAKGVVESVIGEGAMDYAIEAMGGPPTIRMCMYPDMIDAGFMAEIQKNNIFIPYDNSEEITLERLAEGRKLVDYGRGWIYAGKGFYDSED